MLHLNLLRCIFLFSEGPFCSPGYLRLQLSSGFSFKATFSLMYFILYFHSLASLFNDTFPEWYMWCLFSYLFPVLIFYMKRSCKIFGFAYFVKHFHSLTYYLYSYWQSLTHFLWFLLLAGKMILCPWLNQWHLRDY